MIFTDFSGWALNKLFSNILMLYIGLFMCLKWTDIIMMLWCLQIFVGERLDMSFLQIKVFH